MSPRFLITGGRGFIGAALSSALSLKYPVTSVSRRCDCDDPACLTLHQVLENNNNELFESGIAPSCLVHCASLAHRSSPRTADDLRNLYDVNINLAVSFARLASRIGIKRFVFISSIGVHGLSASLSHPICEDSPICPTNPYAFSKSIAEHRLRECLAGSSCELSIIRPALVYGPGMPGNLRLLARGIDAGLAFPLGRVRNHRSFIALGNLISAIEAVALHPYAKGESFVVADEEVISTADLISFIARIRNKPCLMLPMPSRLMQLSCRLPFVGGKVGQLIDDLVVDSSKIRCQLRWRQPFSQIDAMAEAFSLSATPSP